VSPGAWSAPGWGKATVGGAPSHHTERQSEGIPVAEQGDGQVRLSSSLRLTSTVVSMVYPPQQGGSVGVTGLTRVWARYRTSRTRSMRFLRSNGCHMSRQISLITYHITKCMRHAAASASRLLSPGPNMLLESDSPIESVDQDCPAAWKLSRKQDGRSCSPIMVEQSLIGRGPHGAGGGRLRSSSFPSRALTVFGKSTFEPRQ
jgi:hypothetical protein